MDDTTIRSNAPTTTGENDKELGVGTAADENTVRSLLKFHLTHIPSAAEILSAKLNLYLTSSNNSDTAINILDLRQVSGHTLPKFFLWATSRMDCSTSQVARQSEKSL